MLRVTKQLAKQARRPTNGFWGFVAQQLFKINRPTQECTVQGLGIDPDHAVLELGFGFGYGLAHALDNGLREGRGTLYGIDYSTQVCKKVSKMLNQDIASGKLKILNEDVSKMTLRDWSMDRVFHTNCYYFWPSQRDACKEILRVMKPGALMVAGLNMEKLRDGDRWGIVPYAQSDPEKYMESLNASGFEGVRVEDVVHKKTAKDIRLIYATKPL